MMRLLHITAHALPKTIPAMAALCLFCISVSAQTERGSFTVGGGADISSVYQGGTSNFSLSIAPSAGIFVVNSLAIGARYSFGVGTSRVYDVTTSEYVKVTSFTTHIGPSIKYYPGKKALKGVIAANGGYNVFTAIQGKKGLNLNGFSAGGSVGIAHFFNQHISLETVLYANIAGYESLLPSTRIGFSVGLYAFLDKKKQE